MTYKLLTLFSLSVGAIGFAYIEKHFFF